MKRHDPDYGITEEELSSFDHEIESDFENLVSESRLLAVQDVGLALITTWLRKSNIQKASKHCVLDLLRVISIFILVKVFKNGPTNICGRQSLKNRRDMVCLGRPYYFKFFKGCLPQILLGPFLHTLNHLKGALLRLRLLAHKMVLF